MNKKVKDVRKDYQFDESKTLDESDVLADPISQFEIWFKDALKSEPVEGNAMFLATSSKDGKPSVRTVLLKSYDKNGFVFFTNYSSRKGNDLKENPNAALLFFWRKPGRQIRIEGMTEKISRNDSEKYFHSRAVDSQIAAMASNQSSVIENRKTLENKFNGLKQKYEDKEIPLPDNWGGYRLIPERIEFWQGRQNRMHDRILYTRNDEKWKKERLAP